MKARVRADVGQGQTQAGHKRDNANNSDDRDRPQDRPDLKFASMQVCCAMAKPTMRDMETCQEDWSIPRCEAEGKVLVPLAVEW